MTENFKSNVLNYLTGNMEHEEGINEPIFNLEEETLTKNLKNDISTMLASQESATNVSVFGKIYNESFDNFLVYGRYTSSSNFYGYVCIVDSSLNIVSLLTTFENCIFPLYSSAIVTS